MNQQGQSLMETIIAIAVVIVGLIGAIILVNVTLRSTTSTLNRSIALNLSWEAIEVAINIRDSNFLADDPFDTGLNGGADNNAIMTFDEVSNIWFPDFGPDSFSDSAAVMYLQGGLYRQASITPAGTETIYRRLVIFDNSSPGAVRVISTVQWQDRGATKQVQAERILYDWQ